MALEYLQTPCGLLAIYADEKGITKAVFVEAAQESPSPSLLTSQCKVQLSQYFAGELTDFDVPLNARGTDFQRRVWAELRRIPYGETVSYVDIAERLGQPTASRAVGMANGKNPISIIVPCHRVIGKNGSLTGYAGGLERKRYLLTLEHGE